MRAVPIVAVKPVWQLGGSLPKRVVRAKPLDLPKPEVYDELKGGSGKQAVATTMAGVPIMLIQLVAECGPSLTRPSCGIVSSGGGI